MIQTSLSNDGGITIKNGAISFSMGSSIINTESELSKVLLTCENLTIKGTGNAEGAYVNWGDDVLFKNCSIDSPILATGYNSGGTVGTVTFDDNCKIKYNTSLTKDPTWGQEILIFKESYHQKAKVKHYSNDTVEVDLREFIAPGYMWIDTPSSDPNHTEYPYKVIKSKTVTLNLDNGMVSGSYEGYRKNIGDDTVYCFADSLTLPTATEIIRTGYTFDGWYDNENFTGTKATSVSEDGKTYYAKWVNNLASVTHDGTVTYYDSLQNAINASSDGDTIKLLDDISENVSVPSGKELTLDINGKKLTATSISGKINIVDSASSTAAHYFKYYKQDAWTLYDEATDEEKAAAITLAELNDIEEPSDATIIKLMGGIISAGTTLNLNGTVSMSGGTIVGNTSSTYGGGVLVDGGEFIMNDGAAIIGNKTTYSGGAMHITNNRNAKFTMNGGVIAYNYASNDTAGISVGNGNTMKMTGGRIEHNYSAGNIGAIFARTNTTIVIEGNAKIDNNRVNGNSAAIHAGGASLTIKGNAEISNNIANDFGGAVNACGGDTIIEGNARIVENTAGTYGGGVYYSGGNLKIGGEAQITGNLVGSGSEKINQNVYFAGNRTITFLQPGSGMNIGMTMSNAGVFTSNSADGYLDYVHSDDSNCKIVYDSDKKLKLVKKYDVTVDAAITEGTVTTDATTGKAYEGDTVTVTITPDIGYTLENLKYYDGTENHDITATAGVYSFTMPAKNVTIKAEFVIDPTPTPDPPTPDPDPNPDPGPAPTPDPINPTPTPVNPNPVIPVEPKPANTIPAKKLEDFKEEQVDETDERGVLEDIAEAKETEKPDESMKVRTIRVGEGNVRLDAETSEKSPIKAANVETPIAELVEHSDIFTKADIEEINSGANARVWINVDEMDMSGVSEKEQIEVLEIAKSLGGKNEGILYFDITLLKQVGNGDIAYIHEPKTDIEVSLEIPEEIRNTDSNIEREYSVLRIHNENVENLGGEYNEETGCIVFRTGKFSTYVLAYADKPLNSTDEVSDTDGADTKAKAGNVTPFAVILGLLLLIGFVIIIFFVIRRREKEEDEQ